MRFLVFFGGIALSALLLGVHLTGLGDEFLYYPDTLAKFLLLNPPAIVTLLSYGKEATVSLFATSVAWWLFIAILLRRRHARPYQTAFV